MEDNNKQRPWLIVGIVALLVVIAVLIFFLVRAILGSSEPEAPAITDESWTRVQQAGKMVVGTSADYPPFSYYDSQHQIVGFDPALIQAIGGKLGVAVEIHDFAFEGLGGALQAGQIDVAIAAISITPERAAQAGFSDIYYVGEDAILAAEDASLDSIQSADDLAGFRIGAQQGSVYETYLETTLVDTGKLPASNLLLYIRTEEALNDLKEGRVDLVMMDRPPAERFARAGGVKVVGIGLNPQQYVIAALKGSVELIDRVNNALRELYSEGTLTTLAVEYFGLPPEEILPPPTPQPPVITPAPTPTCFDGMAFVDDLNLDDNNMTTPPKLSPGQSFIKGWRIRNTGTCTWDSSYKLEYVYGNSPASRMGGQPTPIQGQVPPGAEYDMYVNLVSPLTPGIYQGFWQMTNQNGVPFGQRIWVGIEVPAAATPTPAPTQTPSSTLTFNAEPTSIQAGQPVIFTWSVTNSKAVYFYAQGQNWQNHPVPAQGTRTEYPQQTTLYELRAVYNDDTVEVRQILINVEPIPQAPSIQRFTVTPDAIIVGDCVLIEWQVLGQVDTTTILRNGTAIWPTAPVSGSLEDCPSTSGNYNYAIDARGPGGTSYTQEIVNVGQPAEATPTVAPPTEAPAPVITSFSVQPEQIMEAGCVNVAWSVDMASLVQIKRDGAIVLDNAPHDGAGQDCLQESGTVVYEVFASNPTGQSVSEQRSVQVEPAPPGPEFTDKTWELTRYYDGVGAMLSVLDGTEVTALFDTEGNLQGSAGCNTYQAKYQTNGNQMTISEIVLTQVLCSDPAGIMEQEDKFIENLEKTTIFQFSDRDLELFDDSQPDQEPQPLLEFIDQEQSR